VAEGSGELRSQWRHVCDVAKDTPDSDPIKQKLQEFMAGNAARYEGVTEKAKTCEEHAARLVKYYGGDKSAGAEDIVGAFRTFVRACRAVQAACHAREAAAAAPSAASTPSASSSLLSRNPKKLQHHQQQQQSHPLLAPLPATTPPATTPHHQPASSSFDVIDIPEPTPRPLIGDAAPSWTPNQLSLNLPPLPPMAAPDLFAARPANTFVVNTVVPIMPVAPAFQAILFR
jgi:hypothetical protein